MDFYKAVVLFTAYSIIGYICEVIYVSSLQKRIVDRGFLYGPVCPVYGFGALLVIYTLKPVSGNIFLLFICALVLTSSLEYFTSWLLETLFNTTWWDYSKYKLNLKGRVCLLNSILFGFLSVIAVYVIQPFFMSIIEKIPDYMLNKIAMGLLVYFMVDLLFSLKKLISFNEHILLLNEFVENLKEKFGSEQWFKGSLRDIFKTIQESSPQEKERLQITPVLLNKIEAFSRRAKSIDQFIRKFPSLTSKKHSFTIEHIKNRIEQYRNDKKHI